jgi:hypothetical protein
MRRWTPGSSGFAQVNDRCDLAARENLKGEHGSGDTGCLRGVWVFAGSFPFPIFSTHTLFLFWRRELPATPRKPRISAINE